MEETSAAEKSVENFRENDIANFIMEATYGSVSKEPRTLEGSFPGSKTRALGHALEVVKIASENDLDAEREYIGKMNEYDLHRIDIHIKNPE